PLTTPVPRSTNSISLSHLTAAWGSILLTATPTYATTSPGSGRRGFLQDGSLRFSLRSRHKKHAAKLPLSGENQSCSERRRKTEFDPCATSSRNFRCDAQRPSCATVW